MSNKSPQRKYQTEFSLNLYSTEPAIVAPSDLDKIDYAEEAAKEHARNSNIYLILKRPRIYFIPDTVSIVNEHICGNLGIQLADGVVTKAFKIKGDVPKTVSDAKESKYPHTKIVLFNSPGEDIYTLPFTYFLPQLEAELEGHDFMEVAYVGQAFGASGDRSAVQRLSSHSTLQKILADIAATQPNMEVFLALYRFEFHRFIISMDGISKAQITGDEDQKHYHEMLEANFKRSMRISLAEAALIRYFQPKYNKDYKNEFPKKRHKMLKRLYDFDFAALSVEVSVEDLGLRLFSETQDANWHHIANFDIHDTNKRKSFFFAAP